MSDVAHPAPASAGRSDVVSVALAVVTAAVPASLLCLAVAAVAHAAGASSAFAPLHPGTFVPLVVIGTVVGAIGWALLRRRGRDPQRLVPVVVVISFVPDLLTGAAGSMAGSGWGPVAALMVMHLVVAGCAVVAYRRFLPVTAARAA